VNGLLESGIELMMIGMGTVFSFLALLVVVTQTMSWAVLKSGLAGDALSPDTANSSATKDAAATGQQVHSAEHVAAIAVALDIHLRAKSL